MDANSRFRGCLLGLACGDAVGAAVEFRDRGEFEPVTDMVGGGRFQLPPGAWTDDTSMALCLATSLVELGRFDPTDQMERYCRWREEGYLSSTGCCFDIGLSIAGALNRFRGTGEPFSGRPDGSAGNGCTMRLAPVPLFFFPEWEEVIHWSGESSRTTHGAPECVEGCRLLGAILFRALSGAGKDEVLFGHGVADLRTDGIRSVARGDYRGKAEADIHGVGYVVRSLEAALWCFLQTDSFEAAVLRAANLGDDADTTAAVCGQVAGAFYGEAGIPDHWRERLVMREAIGQLADRLRQHRQRAEPGISSAPARTFGSGNM
jgi:ADP-ribosyl-[dinitrogen reductase] hydrolase